MWRNKEFAVAPLSEQESFTIRCLRIMAFLAIVLCHLTQAFGMNAAFVFNVGVQVFFALSGCLYGHKQIDEWRRFYASRFRKILLPYYVFLFLVLPLYTIFSRGDLSIYGIVTYFLNLQGFSFAFGLPMIAGIRHLWFITAISMGYLALPLLQRLRPYAALSIVVLTAIMVSLYLFLPKSLTYFLIEVLHLGPCNSAALPVELTFVFSWFYVFSVSYLYFSLRKPVRDFFLGILTIVVVILFIPLSWERIESYFDPINRLWHDFVGLFIVLIFNKLITPPINPKARGGRWNASIRYLDSISYYVYLVHYFLLIGPFSLLYITSNTTVNLIIAIFAIGVVTILFRKLVLWIDNKIGRRA